ncbi:hypothetical protein AHAS_Ahas01G0155500 [Arachis hypogaea]
MCGRKRLVNRSSNEEDTVDQRCYRIKILVTHANGCNVFILGDDAVSQLLGKSCSEFLSENPTFSQSFYDYNVPDTIVSLIKNKHVVFIVDPRPIGYELKTSIHIVRAICDDSSIIKIFEDALNMNQEKLFFLELCVPDIPLEFNHVIQLHSYVNTAGASSSSVQFDGVSPTSVIPCDPLRAAQVSENNVFSAMNFNNDHQDIDLTIGQQLLLCFGQSRVHKDVVEKMDECSG